MKRERSRKWRSARASHPNAERGASRGLLAWRDSEPLEYLSKFHEEEKGPERDLVP
ncbi:hypothetical protein SCP_0102400 [Sparassis crispa]|uniref:Uncharacterized protein n=1 Tax=Sparassis crispa TaxID=139825 RepID=A0A401G5C7_9APHY|nr:hypothetical protein SCP_0102400 [Sparassis crispa]GBE77367.1 hypothetical protein SCP_0102400 [Sparassis crispa]